MASTVDTGDIKQRLFEAPAADAVADDHLLLVDGPVTGPKSASVDVLAAYGLIRAPATSAPISNAAQVLLLDGGRVRRYVLRDAVGKDNQWYLGPFPTAPVTSAIGLPVVPGNTYFDTSTLQMYVYTGATYGWQVQAQLLPANLRTYTWYCRTPQRSFPDMPGFPRDVHGQILQFDPSASEDVTVHLNGAKLVVNVDYFLRPDTTVDLAEPACADSIVEIRVAKRVEVDYATSAVMIRTSGWVFDGNATRFPLYDNSGRRVTAASSVNCMLVVDNALQEPGADFWVVDGFLVTATPLPVGADVWMQVGLPIVPSVFDNAIEVGGGGILEIGAGEPLLFAGLAPVVVNDDTTPTMLPAGLVPLEEAPTPSGAVHGHWCLLSRTGFVDQLLICVKGAAGDFYWQPVIYDAA